MKSYTLGPDTFTLNFNLRLDDEANPVGAGGNGAGGGQNGKDGKAGGNVKKGKKKGKKKKKKRGNAGGGRDRGESYDVVNDGKSGVAAVAAVKRKRTNTWRTV